MKLEAHTIAYLILVQLSYLVIILTAAWQLRKATDTSHYKRHYGISIVLSTIFIYLSFMLASLFLLDFDNAIAGIFFLPLTLIITLAIFLIRKRFVAWWLGIYFLMPDPYSNYVYMKAKGFDAWLHSLWIWGSFTGADIFSMQLVTPSYFILTGEFKMGNTIPLTIMAFEFVLIGLIVAAVDWLVTNKLGKTSQSAQSQN